MSLPDVRTTAPAKPDSATLSGLLGAVNLRISQIAREHESTGRHESRWEFFCECGKQDCKASILLSLSDYIALRESNRPLLTPGHTLTTHRPVSQNV